MKKITFMKLLIIISTFLGGFSIIPVQGGVYSIYLQTVNYELNDYDENGLQESIQISWDANFDGPTGDYYSAILTLDKGGVIIETYTLSNLYVYYDSIEFSSHTFQPINIEGVYTVTLEVQYFSSVDIWTIDLNLFSTLPYLDPDITEAYTTDEDSDGDDDTVWWGFDIDLNSPNTVNATINTYFYDDTYNLLNLVSNNYTFTSTDDENFVQFSGTATHDGLFSSEIELVWNSVKVASKFVNLTLDGFHDSIPSFTLGEIIIIEQDYDSNGNSDALDLSIPVSVDPPSWLETWITLFDEDGVAAIGKSQYELVADGDTILVEGIRTNKTGTFTAELEIIFEKNVLATWVSDPIQLEESLPYFVYSDLLVQPTSVNLLFDIDIPIGFSEEVLVQAEVTKSDIPTFVVTAEGTFFVEPGVQENFELIVGPLEPGEYQAKLEIIHENNVIDTEKLPNFWVIGNKLPVVLLENVIIDHDDNGDGFDGISNLVFVFELLLNEPGEWFPVTANVVLADFQTNSSIVELNEEFQLNFEGSTSYEVSFNELIDGEYEVFFDLNYFGNPLLSWESDKLTLDESFLSSLSRVTSSSSNPALPLAVSILPIFITLGITIIMQKLRP